MASRPASPAETAAAKPHHGFRREVRELWDTLVLAFVLVTMMKMFVVDLYKIPSGSMTPTLIGDWIAWRDFDGDGDDDLLLFDPTRQGDFRARQVFIRGDNGLLRCETDEHRALNASPDAMRFGRSSVRRRFDYILVNKMWYWHQPLGRGDIVVFKLPTQPDPRHADGRSLFDPRTPRFIKRVAALEGETPTIDDAGNLIIDGEIVTEPEIFTRNHYFNDHWNPMRQRWEAMAYLGAPVPDGQFYVFGDNSGNSWDSRHWGGIDGNRVRGRAFFRYWPLREMGLLH